MRLLIVGFAVIAAAAAASLSSEYIPPVQDNSLPSQEYLPPAGQPQAAALADDGYRYKTVRRLRLRHRRDVSELPTAEYLPPAEESQDTVAVEAPAESAPLAEDGYRYRTVRRLRYRRRRRDVDELPTGEYLPPAEAPAAVEAPEESAALVDDGYRYKVVRRLRYRRRRRDVNELPTAEYLPPAEESQDTVAVEAPAESAPLAEDGYRYRTVRRLRYRRRRRDVNELPSGEYLPPVEESQDVVAVEAPADSAALAEDGYRYRTVRRLRYRRRRRDVSELSSSEYLPPVEEAVAVEAPEESAALADDGYRYRTVRRLRYRRRRRDVNELASAEYLPPVEEASQDVAVVDVPAEQTVLADDGYRYKVVRRLKYRRH